MRLNNRGLSMLEAVIGVVLSVIITYGAYTAIQTFLVAGVRGSAAEEARQDAEALNYMARRAIKARYALGNVPAPLEYPPLPTATAPFEGCGTTTAECRALKVHMTNAATGGTRSVEFRTVCEDFATPAEHMQYDGFRRLAGNFACSSNTQRPLVIVINTPDILNPLTFEATEFPRGRVSGAFLCARACGQNVYVETAMIYKNHRRGLDESVAYGVSASTYLVSTQDRNDSIEVLPP